MSFHPSRKRRPAAARTRQPSGGAGRGPCGAFPQPMWYRYHREAENRWRGPTGSDGPGGRIRPIYPATPLLGPEILIAGW